MAQYPVMGAVEDLPYSASRLKLQSGDAIFLYTDGVTEAAAVGRKLFGQQRLLKALAAFGSSAAKDIEGVYDSLREYAGDEVQSDDITMLVKDTWNKWAEGMEANGAFTHEETGLLKQVIEAIPARSTMVHCDYHVGNVMYQRGEIVVIDMADIGFGHPIFDLAAGAFHARYSGSATRQQVHGMTQENMLRFWDKLLALYFGAEDAQKLAEIKEMCDYFGLLRGALFPMKHVQIAPELKAFHVEETRKHLFPNIDKVLSAAKRLPEFFK